MTISNFFLSTQKLPTSQMKNRIRTLFIKIGLQTADIAKLPYYDSFRHNILSHLIQSDFIE